MNKDKLKKSCIKQTKDFLKNYKHIVRFIEKTEKRLKEMGLEENITTVGAITYDSIQVSPTYNIGRITETKALDRIEDETELKIELYKNKKLKKELDRLIYNLSQSQKEVITYRYVDGLSWFETCDKMNYSERQLARKEKEAIKSIATQLYGTKVFEEENPTLFDIINI